MVDGNVVDLSEGDAEQTAGGIERRLDHFLQLQVRLQFRFVEVEEPLPHLLGIVPPVGRREAMVAALFGDECLEVGGLARRPRPAARPNGLEQSRDRFRRLRHLVGEAEVGVGRVAEELRRLGAELRDLGDDLPVVAVAAALAAGDPCLEGLLAEVAPGREGAETSRSRNGPAL